MKAKIIVVVIVMGILCGMVWLKPANSYSYEERRKLTQFPAVSIETIENGNFMEQFEAYGADQFPFRQMFRSLKGFMSPLADTNGLYEIDGYLVKMEYPLHEESIEHASKVFRKIYEKNLQEVSGNIYLSIIPDKNYFLAEECGALKLEYDTLLNRMVEKTTYMEYVDIFSLLSKESYYKTDVHWRQETLEPVANMLLKAMKGERMSQETVQHDKKMASEDFKGVYAGQWGLPIDSENIYYLTNDTIRQMQSYDGENNREMPVYDMEKLNGEDYYEMYLGGPLSLVTIENPNVDTEDELIIFRDSFGSSIAPLLAEQYRKVTLIDIRYIQSNVLDRFVDFTDADVLFLYSVSVLNNSETLK